MTMRIRPLLSKLGLIVGSLAFTLGAAEIGVRVLGLAPAASSPTNGDSLQSIIQFDDKLDTRYRPNAHSTIRSQYGEFAVEYDLNELGLRDRPLPDRAKDRSYRILALGNSFVEGWGVPLNDSFLQIAEMQWNDKRIAGDRPVRMINAGASGYGAAQCFLKLKELLPTVKPDAVVFFYIPTMIAADQKYINRADLDSDRLVTGLNLDSLTKPTSAKASEGSPLDWKGLKTLARFSHLARLIMDRVANYQALCKIVPGDPRSDLLAAYRAPSGDIAEMSEPTFRHIQAMSEIARKAGVPFVVVQLPMPFEVSSIEWGRGRQLYRFDGHGTNETTLKQLAASACQAQNIPLISAHEWLAEHAAKQPSDNHLFFDFDFHLNGSGQRVIGAWLADQLSAQFSF